MLPASGARDMQSFRLLFIGVSMLVAACAAPASLVGVIAHAAETGERLVYVTVAGAPGDGEQALSKALYDSLAARGVKQAGFNDTSVYEIEVLVRIEPEGAGKQTVKI